MSSATQLFQVPTLGSALPLLSRSGESSAFTFASSATDVPSLAVTPAPHALPPWRYRDVDTAALACSTLPPPWTAPLVPRDSRLALSFLLDTPTALPSDSEEAALALASWPSAFPASAFQSPSLTSGSTASAFYAPWPLTHAPTMPTPRSALPLPSSTSLTPMMELVPKMVRTSEPEPRALETEDDLSEGEGFEGAASASASGSRARFVCSFPNCGHAASRAYDLRVHARTHTGEKPFVCAACGKACAHSTTLAYHMRTHSGEKPYACSYEGCGKRFSNVSNLTVHTRVHTGERPYACSYADCGKAFRISTDLSRHVRTHTGEKPFVCDRSGCGKAFAQRSHLNMHRKTHRDD